MGCDLLSYIRVHRDMMTRAERLTAEFILQRAPEVVRMVISQFAAECGVSESTIHRFCVKLGHSGYSETRLLLAECLRDREHESRLRYESAPPKDAYGRIAYGLCERLRSSLNSMCVSLASDTLRKACGRMRAAGHIVLYGGSSSTLFTMQSYQRLMRTVHKVLCPQTGEMQELTAEGFKRGDVALVLSGADVTGRLLSVLRCCRERGGYVIGLACRPDSPLSKLCDLRYNLDISDENAAVEHTMLRCAQSYLIETLCEVYAAGLDVEGADCR